VNVGQLWMNCCANWARGGARHQKGSLKCLRIAAAERVGQSHGPSPADGCLHQALTYPHVYALDERRGTSIAFADSSPVQLQTFST
jgi:hypothetical protein